MLLISLILFCVFIAGGIFVSKLRFNKKVSKLRHDDTCTVKEKPISDELSRIKQLQNNLITAKANAEALTIPVPERLRDDESREETLNKLSRFCEKHSLAQAGAEQLIMSLLPVSQIGSAISSLVDVLPGNLCHAVFGEGAASIKDGIASFGSGEFFTRFLGGIGNMGSHGAADILQALERKDYLSAIWTPFKSGAVEAFRIHDAASQTIESLKDIGDQMQSALEMAPDITALTDVTDIDISGHIPVITIALSSFRELQLLADDKTDMMNSIKNVALDATGTGVGALGGAKAGALTGSLFGPVGAVLGGLIGAVGGGMGGRALTNKIKRRPLEKAIEAYQKAFNAMNKDTEAKSKDTLLVIKQAAEEKKETFEQSELLDSIPVQDTKSAVKAVSLVLYQFLLEEIVKLRKYMDSVRSSVWYRDNEHGPVLIELESRISQLEKELPSVNLVKNAPETAMDSLLYLDMPGVFVREEYQGKVNECGETLKALNDKNEATLLMWTYLVNNLYQKTLSDIAEVSNAEMTKLNGFFADWKSRISALEEQVQTERSRLGL